VGHIRTDEIRRAATIVAGVGQTVRGHVPHEIGGVASALGGGTSGGAGTALAAAWAESYAAWATQAEGHAQSMRDAADAWDAADAHAAGTYDQFPMTPSGPAAWPGVPYASPSASGPTSGSPKLGRFVAGGMEAV
jgi:hypothetical protein